jgi:hypothetical protein
MGDLDTPRALRNYAEWTDRVANGDLPKAKPTRPQGVERNVVVTMWDWADPKTYLHDEISTDKRNPTVNANGPIYGGLEEILTGWVLGQLPDGDEEVARAERTIVDVVCGGLSAGSVVAG